MKWYLSYMELSLTMICMCFCSGLSDSDIASNIFSFKHVLIIIVHY